MVRICNGNIAKICYTNRNLKLKMAEDKSKRKTWTQEEIKGLLRCYMARKEEFLHQRKKRNAYAHVLEDMIAQGLTDSSTTVLALENKMRTLVSAFKCAKDNASRTGATPCNGAYMKEMEEIFGESVIVSTVNTLSIGLQRSKPLTLSKAIIEDSDQPSTSSQASSLPPSPAPLLSVETTSSRSIPLSQPIPQTSQPIPQTSQPRTPPSPLPPAHHTTTTNTTSPSPLPPAHHTPSGPPRIIKRVSRPILIPSIPLSQPLPQTSQPRPSPSPLPPAHHTTTSQTPLAPPRIIKCVSRPNLVPSLQQPTSQPKKYIYLKYIRPISNPQLSPFTELPQTPAVPSPSIENSDPAQSLPSPRHHITTLSTPPPPLLSPPCFEVPISMGPSSSTPLPSAQSLPTPILSPLSLSTSFPLASSFLASIPSATSSSTSSASIPIPSASSSVPLSSSSLTPIPSATSSSTSSASIPIPSASSASIPIPSASSSATSPTAPSIPQSHAGPSRRRRTTREIYYAEKLKLKEKTLEEKTRYHDSVVATLREVEMKKVELLRRKWNL